MPTAIWEEQQRLPVGFLEQIVEYRAYRSAKEAVEAATTADARRRLPDTELIALVTEIEFEIAQEELAARG